MDDFADSFVSWVEIRLGGEKLHAVAFDPQAEYYGFAGQGGTKVVLKAARVRQSRLTIEEPLKSVLKAATAAPGAWQPYALVTIEPKPRRSASVD